MFTSAVQAKSGGEKLRKIGKPSHNSRMAKRGLLDC
jgi:hypothetical protein